MDKTLRAPTKSRKANHPHKLQGADISIRRSAPDDAAAVMRIMADPLVQANLLQMPYPSEAAWRQRLLEDGQLGKPDVLLLAEVDGQVVGSAGLHPITTQLRRRHAAHLGISVMASHHGQGVGSALMKALCDYADQWAQVSRIELTVFADNQRAISLYERFGFVHEGRHRAYAMRAGRFEDVLCMARLHPTPPQL